MRVDSPTANRLVRAKEIARLEQKRAEQKAIEDRLIQEKLRLERLKPNDPTKGNYVDVKV